MSYASLDANVFSIFGKDEWKAEKVKTYPSNFIAVNAGKEYIRVSIIPSGSGVNLVSKSGILIIDIFTTAGNGPKAASLIADKLDKYLQGKSVSSNGTVTQFLSSSLSPAGIDSENKTLSRSTFTIPFNHFGATL